MKTVFKYLFVALIASGTVFHSCETTELEDVVSPNELSPDQSDPNLLLNAIQIAYVNNMSGMSDVSSSLTRVDYMFGRDYTTTFTAATFNGAWTRFYSTQGATNSGIGPNVAVIETLNEDPDSNLNYHLGVAKALQAHQLMCLVDFLGDIPWSEALNPDEFPSPMADDDATVYGVAGQLLDESLGFFAAADGATVNDFFYAGDTSKWVKLVNTLKMRRALTSRDDAGFNTLVAAGNFIESNDDDFQFTYGLEQLPVDIRHPDYIADYTTSGANIYQSNWLMSTMQGADKSDPSDDDPRMRYYFFRQTDCTPGASCNPDGNGEVLSCSLQDNPPAHYSSSDPFCYLEDGYFGRDHGNDEGTPPDGALRTAAGVYPAGGMFDDNRFGGLTLGTGGGGAGVQPFVLASYVDFWRAEVALRGGNAGSASDFVEAGIQKSIDKASTFAALDGDRDTSYEIGGANYDRADVAAFIAAQGARITDTGDDSWNALAENNFVTLFGGGGSLAYNFYRRTGYPTTVQPSIEPNPGPFPTIIYYPTVETVTNPNINQRTELTGRVFWNEGDPTPPGN